jgi:hypothetical protein
LRAAALPTPETIEKGKGKSVDLPDPAPLQSPSRGAPTVAQERELIPEQSLDSSSLATKVIRLVREENVDLKESTELQIRHEIDVEMDMNAARMKRYEVTVSKLKKKVDELESSLGHLMGLDEGSES